MCRNHPMIMKYLTIPPLLGLAMALAPAVAEDDTKPERDGRKGGPGLFRELDQDGDRAISKEEAGDHWQRLGRLDENDDGKVTGREMLKGRPGGPGKGGPGKPGARLLERADENGDGKLSQDEVPERAWERLSKLDADEDGAVTREELAKGMKNRPNSGPGGGRGAFFERADENGDGKLSQDEVPERAWERLSRLDEDGDGAVTREEAAEGMKGGGPGRAGRGGRPAGPEAMFSRLDEDEDGKLSEQEAPGEMWSKLRKADENADGLVSRDELENVFEERRGRMRPGGDEPGGKSKPEEEGDAD